MSCKSTEPSVKSNIDAVSVLCELVRQDLGINGRVCCIASGDQEEEVFAKDTVQILKCLDIQHPAGVYVAQACVGHKDLYGCGVKSLLFLTGQLLAQVHSLIQQGVPLLYIAELLNEALDHCTEHMERVSVPVILSDEPSHSHHPRGSSYQVPSSPSRMSQRHAQKGLPPCNSVQSVQPHLESSRFDLSVKETKPDVLTASQIGAVGTKSDYVRTSQNSKASLLKSHKSETTTKSNSETLGVNAHLPELNKILQHHLRPSTSASLHRNVMLRSRHLQQGDSSDEEKKCETSEPSKISSFSAIGQEHSCQHHQSETACVQPNFHDCSSCISSTVEHQFCSHRKSLSSPQNNRRADGMFAIKKVSVMLPEDAQSLSHGCHEMMTWAKEAMRRHLLHGRRFDASLFHTLCVGGREGKHQLLEGLVVSAGSDGMVEISKITGPSSVLLVNGDLTAEFKHRGHKAALPSVRVTENMESFLHHSSDSWHCQVLDRLKQLDVQVVLVRGTVNPDLCAACMAAGIALVSHVPFPALKVLQSACQVDFVTYILDAHEGNICQGVSLKPLREDWCDTVYLDRKHLVITPPVFVQTLVIVASSTAGKEIREEEFWHCVARLALAAEDGRVLEGGGGTEELCAHLLTSADHPGSVRGRWAGEMSLYRPLVRAALAEAFFSFTRMVQLNRQRAGCVTPSVQKALTTGHSAQPSVHNVRPCLCRCPSLNSSGNSHHQTCHSVSGTFEKFVRSESNPRESSSDKESYSSVPPSEHCDCSKQRSREAGCSPSVPALDEMVGSKPNFQDRHHAVKTQQFCRCSGHSLCISSQGEETTEQSLSGIDSLCTVCGNTDAEHDVDETVVWDNYRSKVSGWRSAVQCVCMLMRMDEVITTGIDQGSLPPHSVLL